MVEFAGYGSWYEYVVDRICKCSGSYLVCSLSSLSTSQDLHRATHAEHGTQEACA